MSSYTVVGANIDTWILNVKGDLLEELGEQLDALKEASQETDEDIPIPWSFAGELLYIKAHGSGRQWRWILHCPSLHLDVGRGKLNHIIGKARLSSAFLWEQGPGEALHALYTFLIGFIGEGFTLQVSEVHLCADIAGWEPTLDDANAFITRGHKRKLRMARPGDEDNEDSEGDDGTETGEAGTMPFELASCEINQDGRHCTGYEFAKGAAHSCCLYDKTKEITRSRKDWMKAVWQANGWDGTSRVIRVEFRYKRECLHELGVDEPYEFLDQLPGLWAYSTFQWLRHTQPTADTNRGRWSVSPFWQAIQEADFFGQGVPAVRKRKHVGNLTLICQMLAGCSTTAAAYLAGQLPDWDDGANFLTWFYDWMAVYLQQKGVTFEVIRHDKRRRLGVIEPDGAAA